MWLKLFVVLCGLLIGYFTYQLQRHPQLAANSIADRITHPSDIRVRYAIGRIDPEFNVSFSEVLLLSEQAAHIWEQGVGKPLFVYDPQAKLKINLIYDERQQKSQYVRDMNQKTQKASAEIDVLYQQLQQMADALKQRDQQLQSEFEQVRQAQAGWQRLEHEDGENRQRLYQLEQVLKHKRQQLSAEWQIYQQKVQSYNAQINHFNQGIDKVRQYNQNNPAKVFSKGEHRGDVINVFEFESQTELRIVIAHEFGHALGLGHHHDPQALMYPLMEVQAVDNFRLAASDIALFQQN